ncbi:endonuclease/exonuclease/phosphatase family protein [Pontivivens insulae]|uniref:endonuclease/exonuclease/phosphatase family protein n=1 Tax=Pontivivens insulae TaxID=1639689 RepID=UPI001FE5E762|nr:endonuclease/exonuclease/phosphatase family protein [Pontivivens insulae]
MALTVAAALLALPAAADTIRIATFNAALERPYAGALLRDIERGTEDVMAAVSVIAAVQPDIILINELDHDPQRRAALAFQQRLSEAGVDLPHVFTAPVNAGELTGLDLDGDGSLTGPRDAHGFGRWPGHYGMALFSRYPVGEVRTFQTELWRDVPDSRMPQDHFGLEAENLLRLSSKSHWDVELRLPGAPLHLLAAHPTPPVFDGPEDANGRRNADEIAFWLRYLDGEPVVDDTGEARPIGPAPVVVLGDLNADPADGDGWHDVIAALLAHPRVQDTEPRSQMAATLTGGVNAAHQGDPALDTADWNDERGPGNLRVDYVLPDAALEVVGSGVFWPMEDQPLAAEAAVSDHRLVWVDIRWDPASD